MLDLFDRYGEKDADYHVEAIRIKELPFDSTRKMMSINSENHLYTKGAVDVILDRCDQILIHDKSVQLLKKILN